jgi:hypothetical protein
VSAGRREGPSRLCGLKDARQRRAPVSDLQKLFPGRASARLGFGYRAGDPVEPDPPEVPLLDGPELELPSAGAEPPLVPDSVVVPGPDVVPVPAAPAAPMPVLVLLRAAPVALVELGLGLVDWQPAASTAARVKPSSVAGRKVDVKGMRIPRDANAKCAAARRQSTYPWDELMRVRATA